MKRKRIPSARRIFRRAVRESPHNAHLLQAWGVLEERECDVTRAKELFDAAVRADAEHCAAWVALGLWHQRYDGDIEKAREMFRTGAEAQPDNYYVWHVWGVLERNCRNFPLARLYFRRGTEANPRNAATFVLWGALEDGLGNSEAAFRLFEKAHGANGRNVHAYVAHAVARERMGDVKMARRLLRRGMKIRPDDAAMWQTMGLLEFRLGDVEKARRLFKKGLAVDERHAPSWCAWAGVEEKCGHFDRARELFQQAVWARPRGADAVRTWHAWACLEMADGKWEAARRCFAHGLKMGPSNVALLTGIGRVEAEAGDMAQARKYFEMAVGLEPRLKATWKLYQQMEMTFGSRKRAQSVYQRHLSVVGKKEERVMVSDALPGDYMAGGMWCEQPKERVDKLGDKYSSGSLLPPNSSYNLNFTVNAFNLTT